MIKFLSKNNPDEFGYPFKGLHSFNEMKNPAKGYFYFDNLCIDNNKSSSLHLFNGLLTMLKQIACSLFKFSTLIC